MKGNGELVRIIPAPAKESGGVPTQGTQVMVGDTKIKGVTRIELVADLNDVWRARIELMVQPPEMSAVATFHGPTLWQRFKRWLREHHVFAVART